MKPLQLSALILLGCFMVPPSQAQFVPACQTYSGPGILGAEWVADVQPDASGGFLAATLIAKPPEDLQLGVMNVGPDGTLEWVAAVGETYTIQEPDAVLRLPTGRIFIAGMRYSEGEDACLACFDATGASLWTRLYRVPASEPLGHSSRFKAAIRANTDTLVFAGYRGAQESDDFRPDAMVMAVDTNGDVLWITTVGDDGWSDRANDIVRLSDGGYAVAGMSYTNDVTHAFVFKLNASGGLVWSWRYDFDTYSEAQAVVEGSEGDVIVAGMANGPNNADFYWMRLSSDGTVIEVRRYGTDGADSGLDMVRTSDGGYALAGSTYSDLGHPEIAAGALVKTDSHGNFQWGRQYQATITTRLHTLYQTADQGYILGGRTSWYTTSGWSDALLLRTDSLGLACPACDAGPFGSEYPGSATAIAGGVVGHPDYALDTLGGDVPPITVTDLCATESIHSDDVELALIQASPQPADASVSITLPMTQGVPLSLRLFDARGSSVPVAWSYATGATGLSIATSDLESGSYIAVISSPSAVWSLPVMVLH